MDSTLIYVTNKRELEKTTAVMIQGIEEAGLTINKGKCMFFVAKIKFRGRILSTRNMELHPEVVDVFGKLREPENKTELQRLPDMVTYLAKIIPNLSDITHLPRKLLEMESYWV